MENQIVIDVRGVHGAADVVKVAQHAAETLDVDVTVRWDVPKDHALDALKAALVAARDEAWDSMIGVTNDATVTWEVAEGGPVAGVRVTLCR